MQQLVDLEVVQREASRIVHGESPTQLRKFVRGSIRRVTTSVIAPLDKANLARPRESDV